MKKIGNTIIETNITNVDTLKERTTVRGVILKENKVYMLYSKMFNDYTFPGGGVKENEELLSTLKRELLEEIGAKQVEIINSIGYTEEIRFGISGSNSIYKQTSHYYLCEPKEYVEPLYMGREKLQGLEGVWINIDDAITHNNKITKEERMDSKGYQTVLIRENLVLEHIKENLL